MKFAVAIALFGLAAAADRHGSTTFLQTKFVNFNEMKDDEEATAPTAEQLRVQAEIAEKAKKIATATKEVEATAEADAVKTNKEKAKEAKEFNEKVATAAKKVDLVAEDSDTVACAKQREAEAAAKKAKEQKVADFAAMVKDKTDDMDWAASMPDDIVNGKKYKSGPLKYANVQIN